MATARYRVSGINRDALHNAAGYAALCNDYCYHWPGFNLEHNGTMEFGGVGVGGPLPTPPAATLPGGRTLIHWVPYSNGDLFRPTAQFDPACPCRWGLATSHVHAGFTYNYNASEIWIAGTTWGQTLRWNIALRALYSLTFPPNSAAVVNYFAGETKLSDVDGYVFDPTIIIPGFPATPGNLEIRKFGYPTKAAITIDGAAPVSGADVNGTFLLQLIDHMLDPSPPPWGNCPPIAGAFANWGYTRTVPGHTISYVLYVSYEVTYFRFILDVVVDGSVTISWSSAVGAAPTASELYAETMLFKNPPVPSELATASLVPPV